MSRPISRTRRFWHWLEGDRTRARVIRMPPPPPARDGDPLPAAPVAARPAPEPQPAPARADRRAALVAAFDPAHPIRHARDLRGRKDALDGLAEAMLVQRQHAIIHGLRGSGKTSLVRIFADRADRQGVVLIYVSCERKAGFADLVRPLLLTIPASNIAIGGERDFRSQVAALPGAFGPQATVALLNTLEPTPIVFILDEFDRITDPEVREEVATFMKLLSDTLSPVQLLVVGIATSVDGLIASHPSLRRHMTAIAIGAIADREIDRLLADGGTRAGLPFTPEARALIVDVACGSPYHARLFGYSAGTRALARDGDRVTREDAADGLEAAFARWARLNARDSALFRDLARRDPGTRGALRDAALYLARAPEPLADPAATLLQPALDADAPHGKPAFLDNTAAQFLLAALALADPPERNGRG